MLLRMLPELPPLLREDDMIVLINIIGFLIIAIFFGKLILHYKYLESINAYSYNTSPGNSLVSKDKIRKYLLLFNASIMFPVFSSKGDRKTRRIINVLVLSFYLMIVCIYFLIANERSLYPFP
jgi:hypothetical protein